MPNLEKVSVVIRLRDLITDADVDINCRDWSRNTPFMLLCRNDSIRSQRFQEERILNILLESIDVLATDFRGRNALHLLGQFNSNGQFVNIASQLIEKGIDLNLKDHQGYTVLHLICLYHRYDSNLLQATQMLIENDIDIQATNNYNENVLHLLCLNHSSDEIKDVVRLLIDEGINVHSLDLNMRNPLHNFCCHPWLSESAVEVGEILINSGIDLNAKDYEGNNSFHLLCQFINSPNALYIAFLLIEAGIDINAVNRERKNAMQLLCRSNKNIILKKKIAKLLIKRGIHIPSYSYDDETEDFLQEMLKSGDIIIHSFDSTVIIDADFVTYAD